MRYHYEPLDYYGRQLYGKTEYTSKHPVYDRCTVFDKYDIETGITKGISVIQQYYNPITKITSWKELMPELANTIYLNSNFGAYFNDNAKERDEKGLYPTVTVRQIMHALKMKPLKKEPWETYFCRRFI